VDVVLEENLFGEDGANTEAFLKYEQEMIAKKVRNKALL